MTAQRNENLEDVITFIKEHPAVALATATAAGEPNSAVVYCVIGDGNTLEFLSVRDTAKSRGLLENPRASVLAFDIKMAATAKVSGTVEEVTDPARQTALFNQVMTLTQAVQGDHLPPVTQLDAGGYVFFRLHPEQWALTRYV